MKYVMLKSCVLLLVIIEVLFFNNCSNVTNDSTVKILSNTDTVMVGDTFIAKLQVNYNDSILPLVYLIDGKDTFYMPFYEDERCAIIQIMGSKLGKEKWNGFVEYLNLEGEQVKEKFSIEFTRIPK